MSLKHGSYMTYMHLNTKTIYNIEKHFILRSPIQLRKLKGNVADRQSVGTLMKTQSRRRNEDEADQENGDNQKNNQDEAIDRK